VREVVASAWGEPTRARRQGPESLRALSSTPASPHPGRSAPRRL